MALVIKPFWHFRLNAPALQPLKLTVPIVSSLGSVLFQGKASQCTCVGLALCVTKQKMQGTNTIMILWWIYFCPALVTVDMSTTHCFSPPWSFNGQRRRAHLLHPSSRDSCRSRNAMRFTDQLVEKVPMRCFSTLIL
jgi:hypothetical protein